MARNNLFACGSGAHQYFNSFKIRQKNTVITQMQCLSQIPEHDSILTTPIDYYLKMPSNSEKLSILQILINQLHQRALKITIQKVCIRISIQCHNLPKMVKIHEDLHELINYIFLSERFHRESSAALKSLPGAVHSVIDLIHKVYLCSLYFRTSPPAPLTFLYVYLLSLPQL